VELGGGSAELVWHERTDLGGADAVILPGGFAHGDYLRSGAIARFSPVMGAGRDHAERGGLTLGICNGFQVLTEARLLPGVLRRNTTLRFEHRWVRLGVERRDTAFTHAVPEGMALRMPIAHGEGAYWLPDSDLDELEANGQVLFRYVAPEGNPNGAERDIAGVINERGNVCGLMPHPERASEALLGSDDGLWLLRSLVESMARVGVAA
jgi:phosphoribosylformylglycinamidine synthase